MRTLSLSSSRHSNVQPKCRSKHRRGHTTNQLLASLWYRITVNLFSHPERTNRFSNHVTNFNRPQFKIWTEILHLVVFGTTNRFYVSVSLMPSINTTIRGWSNNSLLWQVCECGPCLILPAKVFKCTSAEVLSASDTMSTINRRTSDVTERLSKWVSERMNACRHGWLGWCISLCASHLCFHFGIFIPYVVCKHFSSFICLSCHRAAVAVVSHHSIHDSSRMPRTSFRLIDSFWMGLLTEIWSSSSSTLGALNDFWLNNNQQSGRPCEVSYYILWTEFDFAYHTDQVLNYSFVSTAIFFLAFICVRPKIPYVWKHIGITWVKLMGDYLLNVSAFHLFDERAESQNKKKCCILTHKYVTMRRV